MDNREARRVVRRVHNPPNPFHATLVETLVPSDEASVEVFEDRSKTILSKNTSPDLGFDFSVNPYRGCFHGCAYCYARPTHQYLDFGAGTDFERKLVVKPQAPALLRAAFMKRSWTGQRVVFSGNTDCYQPLEAQWGLTRACLAVCREFRNPMSIITKSPLIERDIALLAELNELTTCHVTISLPFIDTEHARAVEPYVASPQRRLKTIRRLAEAGVPVGVNVAPIIPGLNDAEIGAVLEASRAAGARWAGWTLVRLPGPVAEVFARRIALTLPLRAERIMQQIRACRGGQDNDSRFGPRMVGQGPRAAVIGEVFGKLKRRLGFEDPSPPTGPTTFRRPDATGQLALL